MVYGGKYAGKKSVQRFYSVDPLQSKMPEWSSYNYGYCNPITWTDSTGMQPDDPNWHPPMSAQPEGGFKSGVGSSWNPIELPEVTVTAQANQPAGEVSGGGELGMNFTWGMDEPLASLDDLQQNVTVYFDTPLTLSGEVKENTSGNSKGNITAADYERIAEKLGVEPAVIQAIAEVESSGGGFNKDGSVKVRFEGHQFKKYLTKQGVDVNALIQQGYGDIIYSYSERGNKPHGYSAYNKAAGLNEKGAIYATSFGAFQIMGFNYSAAGHKSMEAFKEAQSTFTGQVESFINFVSKNKELLQAMKNKDFATFARLYNGPNYSSNQYDIKMLAKYNKYKN